jgi:4-hydroxy-tetrahydrodipicolinate reductase
MTIQVVREKTPVMVSGLPGKMATLVARAIQDSPDFSLSRCALTDANESRTTISIGQQEIRLHRPDQRGMACIGSGVARGNGLVVDFTVPEAVLPNGLFYISQGWNFVMGTTGGDREALEQAIRTSQIRALMAPNLAKPVVALQQIISEFALKNRDGLKGCTIRIEESHQAPDPERPEFKGKKDPSGTAIAISKYLGIMGVEGCPFEAAKILAEPEKYKETFVMVRSRKYQLEKLGVPKDYLDGHGWHTYLITRISNADAFWPFVRALYGFMSDNSLFAPYSKSEEDNSSRSLVTRMSPDRTVLFETGSSHRDDNLLMFRHNINGRGIYVDGALEGLQFLRGRTEVGKVFSTVDTLK